MSETIVIKIGTSSLTNRQTGNLALTIIANLVETATYLHQAGYNVVLVSSGAVGVGCDRLGLTEKPKNIALKQAVAAVGQGRLMRIYDDFFSSLQQAIAQVLLTRADLSRRSSYLNAHNTFVQLLKLGVIPIVNENDTTAIEELKFGDNDTLSALVASLIEADWLFILTDVDHLYSADPRDNPEAVPITIVENIEELQVKVGDSASGWGTGGMITKIEAARIATSCGVRTVITSGQNPSNIAKIVAGENFGTHFLPQKRPVNARKHWIANVLVPRGKLFLDDGAVRAIAQSGKSLLAAGIKQIEGEFAVTDAVQICNLQGEAIARGLVNYNSSELEKIQGCQSDEIPQILGYDDPPETVIHRDNLVVIN